MKVKPTTRYPTSRWAARSQPRQLPGESDPREARERVPEAVHQPVHLLVHRGPHVSVAVARGGHPEPPGEIDEAIAVRIVHVGPPSPLPDDGVLVHAEVLRPSGPASRDGRALVGGEDVDPAPRDRARDRTRHGRKRRPDLGVGRGEERR